MKLPRRQFLRLTGAVVAAPAIGLAACGRPETAQPKSEPASTRPPRKLVDKLNIKREEIQQTANLKGAFFGENEDDQEGNQRGRSLLWRFRGSEPRDIAWQLAQASVVVFQRPSASIARIAPLEITFRCTVWSRGYESLMSDKDGGGCFLEVVLLNKDGLTLNHLPLKLSGFDIRCGFRGNNVIPPSLPYVPVDNAVFGDISHIQLFDRSGSQYPDFPYVRASQCTAA